MTRTYHGKRIILQYIMGKSVLRHRCFDFVPLKYWNRYLAVHKVIILDTFNPWYMVQ